MKKEEEMKEMKKKFSHLMDKMGGLQVHNRIKAVGAPC
jgi:hypothetical protein